MDVVERARRPTRPGRPRRPRSGPSSPRCSPRATQPTGSRSRPATGGPAVVLVVGVNGTGKTTTIGKLAARERGEGPARSSSPPPTRSAPRRSTSSGSGPSGRARRSSPTPRVPIPAAVVFDALDAAVARHADVVIADTAGRLHTKSNLMDELAKVRRIIDKRLPGAEPETLFVLDATTGQNGLAQAMAFHEAVGLTGSRPDQARLDRRRAASCSRSSTTLGVPVRFVGVGEQAGDLLPFDPEAFVDALFA